MTPNDPIEVLRAKWLELEYDSIMSGSPGEYIWSILKCDSFNMTRDEFIESLTEQEAFDDPQT